MMTCAQARPLLSEHLDHELPTADSAQVGAHIISCADCGRAFDDLKRIGRAVRDLPLHPLPAGFLSKLERRRAAPLPSVPDLASWLAPRHVAFAAAAVLVGLVIAGPWRSERLARAPGEALTSRELPSLKLKSEPPPPALDSLSAPAPAAVPPPPTSGFAGGGGQPFGESPAMTNADLQKGLKEESDRLGLEPYKAAPPASEPFLGRRLGTAEGRARGEAAIRGFAQARQAIDEGAGKRTHAVGGSVAPVLGARRSAGSVVDASQLEDGFWSGEFAAGNEGNRTIASQEEWSTVWRSLSTAPPPAVDFDRTQLLCVFLGPRPTGGYSVEFVETRRTASQLLVRYREHAPVPGITPPQGATSPYAIKAVPKTDLPVRFEKTR